MFDIGWQELFIVAVLALIVVGPKDLPRALRTIMGLVRKARLMARDFQDGLDEVVREADLDDMKNKLESLSEGDISKSIQDTVDPTGGLASDLNMTEIQNDLDSMGNEVTEVASTETPAAPTETPAAPARSVGEEAKTPQPDADKEA